MGFCSVWVINPERKKKVIFSARVVVLLARILQVFVGSCRCFFEVRMYSGVAQFSERERDQLIWAERRGRMEKRRRRGNEDPANKQYTSQNPTTKPAHLNIQL